MALNTPAPSLELLSAHLVEAKGRAAWTTESPALLPQSALTTEWHTLPCPLVHSRAQGSTS